MTAARTQTILELDEREDGFALTAEPRLHWRVSTSTTDWRQASAELRIVRGNGTEHRHHVSGAVSAASWPFAPIAPRERVALSARATGADGADADWSEPFTVLGGTLDDHGWSAAFIGGNSYDPVLLRGEVSLRAAPSRATLYITSFGAHEVHVNGQRIGDRELAPGWTSYQWRVDYDVHDVTAALGAGDNVVGIGLAGAWFTEEYGFRDAAAKFYEGTPSASAILVVENADGSTARYTTGQGWTVSRGGCRSAGLYQGERFDARREPTGWAALDFDASDWAPVVISDAPPYVPTPRIAPPVRVTEEITPVRVWKSPSGAALVDFGQNLVGRLRLRTSAPEGTEIRLRHAEVLENGELARRPLRNAAAEDIYIAAGGRADWEPTWTFHGFRFAEIDGLPEEVSAESVTAQVLGTDLRRTGGFRTSAALVQKLHDNVVWGARGNFLSVPTDCPQRDERLGWTGDTQVFASSAAFLFASERFLRSWMVDVLHEQRGADGIVPMVVPAVIPQVPGLFEPIAAWGDAVTVVPDALYEATADDSSIRAALDGMLDWVDVILAKSTADGLWEDGRQFGDWLDPDAPPDLPGHGKTDPGIVATAYFFRSASIAASAARRLGRSDEAERMEKLALRVRSAFCEAYVTPTGRMMSDSTTAYALAIAFGMVDEEMRSRLGDRLAHLVRRGGYHIDTGFVGTPIVLSALSRTGHGSTAARLLAQTENPSWLYPVTMGATTVWERWDSMLEDGSVNPGQMTSFNHYALGAVADWLHRTAAGIAPLEPGYSRFAFAPDVSCGLPDAAAWHDSPHGRIEAEWALSDGGAVLRLTVPPNTTAEARLPNGDEHVVGSGSHEWEVALQPAPAQATVPSLDGPMTDVVDDPEAYRVLIDCLAEWDPAYAKRFRRTVRWTPGRRLRDPLDKVPVRVMEQIEQRFGDLSRSRS